MTRARELANLGSNTTDLEAINAVYDAGGLTGRNLIINGAMQVAQRSTSTASITTSAYHTVDRWSTSLTTLGTWTQSQSTDVPSGQGFASSLKMACTTADASPAAGDRLLIRQALEGQNVQQLKKGTANAESVTLSFWVKSSKTGTYIVEIYDQDNTRNIAKAYTVSSANTWEKKEVTFSGDTTGAFDNDASASLYLNMWLGAGSTYTSGTLATSWQSATSANRAVGQVNLADSISNEWYITGVQLEVGETATPFEHRSYGDELARCQRYYCNVASFNRDNFGQLYSSTQGKVALKFPVIMRAAATVTANSPFTNMLEESGVAVRTPSTAAVNYNNTSGCIMSFNVTGTAGNGLFVRQCPSDTTIEADAEL
jgi:hypothetical protein